MTKRWSSKSREAETQRSALVHLARTLPRQLQAAFKPAPPKAPAPHGRLLVLPHDSWRWRELESQLGIATSAPVRALSNILWRKCRPLSMTALGRVCRLKHLKLLSIGAVSRRNRARALEQLADLPQLDELRVEAGIAGDDLSFVRPLPSLRTLRVRRCEADLAPLAEAASLDALHLLVTNLTPARLQPMRRLQRLTTLNLAYSKGLDPRGLENLTQMAGLRRLGLEATDLSEPHLERVGAMTALEVLDLGNHWTRMAGIDDRGLAHLQRLRRLTHLDLSGNRSVTDTGAATLGGLRDITWLKLDMCKITDAGIERLHPLTKLRFLNLGVSGVSDAALDALRSCVTGELEVVRTTLEEWEAELQRQF